MRKRPIILAVIAIAGLVMLLGGNTARNAARWQPIVESPSEREALLAPSWRFETPPGAGPFKAAVLLSGCDGVHDNMDLWADEMRERGRATLIVDSHGPRGFDQMQAWRAVCAAQILTGAERAGDLAVAISWLSRRDDIDPKDMLLLGASHGGWSVMELLELLDGGTPPPGLSQWPLAPERLSSFIGPVVLLYPYCGMISGAGDAIWPHSARGLMVLGQEDSVVDPEKCAKMAEGLEARGARIEVLELAGADHGFDQHDRSVLSTLAYDQSLVDQTKAALSAFLGEGQGASALP